MKLDSTPELSCCGKKEQVDGFSVEQDSKIGYPVKSTIFFGSTQPVSEILLVALCIAI
jgi:hypothetical protein